MNLCLIPAAGFGKRLGTPPAKELLLDPENRKPLIDWALELAIESGLKPLVISRFEKQSLNSYLRERWSGVELLLIESSKEWPDTILKSEPLWREVNLLLLPDTRFAPRTLARQLVEDCVSHYDSAIGIFDGEDRLQTWGAIDETSTGLRVCEKPNTFTSRARPWGLIAFRKTIGHDLFSELLRSNQTHSWVDWRGTYRLRQLEFFKDITRNISDLGV